MVFYLYPCYGKTEKSLAFESAPNIFLYIYFSICYIISAVLSMECSVFISV